LNAAYAKGMTEYTAGWTFFKSSDVKRNTGGYVTKDVSWVYALNGIETPTSWNLAAQYTHFWTPSIRNSFMASYGKINATASQKAAVFNATNAYGDATVWNAGVQLAWLPVAGFEIGVEALYNRVSQDVRRTLATDTNLVTKQTEGNWTGRMRVERTF
jgi:hypothetical protein